jgi:LytS/YehU family sensor histidine kinase
MPAVILIPKDQHDPYHILLNLALPINMCIVFYINYLWIVPKLALKKRYRLFFFVNTVLVIFFALLTHHAWLQLHPTGTSGTLLKTLTFFVARKMLLLTVPIVLATLIQQSLHWYQIEEKQKESEMQRKELELKNLQSQFNPHFLLNTLNNIYALISFDQKKAQKAVISLSELMRQMLYGNEQTDINLQDEIQFIDNYINLMRLRLPQTVEIDVRYDIPEPCRIRIAPLIFISLVENAFKHGVSLSEPCFISIHLSADDHQICFESSNSNFPKSKKDSSGHGIGLDQVQRRLDILYPENYKWEKGILKDNNTYISKITIYDTKLCHH